MKRICLWSCPRNISTALMYSFAQRPDTVAVDEPMYAHYLNTTGAPHPGREEILCAMQNDGEKVVADVIMGSYNKPVVFFKQMTHHLLNVSTAFLEHTLNIIFIRNPAQIIASYAQVMPSVSLQDIGVEYQYHLFSYLAEKNLHCVVLDSGELMKNPERILTELCNSLGLAFLSEMMHWPAGPKPYDGIWARYWYENVHKTTGFEVQQTSSRPLPEHLQPLYRECRTYYDKLFTHSLKAD